MTYKLINKITNEEHICSKVVIDGYDYYVSDETVIEGLFISMGNNGNSLLYHTNEILPASCSKKVIATNNPNIDIPQILEEPNETLIHQIAADLGYRMLPDDLEEGIKAGYKESQETHPFSEEDMIEFNEWYYNSFLDDLIGLNGREVMNKYQHLKNKGITKEVIQIWKEQRIKTIYYDE